MKSPSPPLLFNRAALREIDRRAVEEFSIPVLLLMENAGRAVAQAAVRHLKPNASIAIVCGSGNNGGDGLVAARHLHNASIPVHLFLLDPPSKFKNEPATHLAIAEKMKLPIEVLTAGHAELRDWIVDGNPDDLIINALFGTGLSRPVEGLAAEIIAALNSSRRTILSIDIPSGLDTDTGQPLGAAIRAAETVSFCGNKLGFTQPGASAYTGKITIADVAAPIELLQQLALKPTAPPANKT